MDDTALCSPLWGADADLFETFLVTLTPKARAELLGRVPGGVPRQMLDVHRVLDLVPVSHASLWRMMDAGTFPSGVMLAGRRLWFADDVAHWQRAFQASGQPIDGRKRRERRPRRYK